jgi:hypothetical protein
MNDRVRLNRTFSFFCPPLNFFPLYFYLLGFAAHHLCFLFPSYPFLHVLTFLLLVSTYLPQFFLLPSPIYPTFFSFFFLFTFPISSSPFYIYSFFFQFSPFPLIFFLIFMHMAESPCILCGPAFGGLMFLTVQVG